MQSEWTFLFTDVEGSTALWEIDEDAMRAALVRHDELIRHRVARHGGIVFATGGDSFSVAFADAGQTDEAAALFVDALRLNGVGDRGEMLWYTVLNIAEHLLRTDRPRVAALAVASYLQAPSAPRDALVERGLSRFTSTLREMLGAEEWRSVDVEAQALTLSAFLSRLQDELEGAPTRS